MRELREATLFNKEAKWRVHLPPSLGELKQHEQKTETIQHQQLKNLTARVHWEIHQKENPKGAVIRERIPIAFSLQDRDTNTMIVWDTPNNFYTAKTDQKTGEITNRQPLANAELRQAFKKLIRSAIELHPEKRKLFDLYYDMAGS